MDTLITTIERIQAGKIAPEIKTEYEIQVKSLSGWCIVEGGITNKEYAESRERTYFIHTGCPVRIVTVKREWDNG